MSGPGGLQTADSRREGDVLPSAICHLLIQFPSLRRKPSRYPLPVTTASATRRWLRPIYFVLGVAFLGIGIVGAFLPLIPTTGPLLLSAFLLARSSDRIHSWLVNHRRFGRFISDFEDGRGIPLRTKVVAVTAMSLAFGYTIGWVLPHPVARGIVVTIWAWAAWYVLHLPTSRGVR